MNLDDLISDPDPFAVSTRAVEGVIVSAPATRNDLVRVSVAAFDDEQTFGGPLRWARDGDHLPSVGDSCLVQVTPTGTAWVTAWWSES